MSRSRELKKASDLFEKYKTILKPPQATVEKECAAVIEEVVGITVSADKLSYTPSNKTLALKVPSVLKQEIMLHKEEVVLHTIGRVGDHLKGLTII